jgi:hypothetical protein
MLPQDLPSRVRGTSARRPISPGAARESSAVGNQPSRCATIPRGAGSTRGVPHARPTALPEVPHQAEGLAILQRHLPHLGRTRHRPRPLRIRALLGPRHGVNLTAPNEMHWPRAGVQEDQHRTGARPRLRRSREVPRDLHQLRFAKFTCWASARNSRLRASGAREGRGIFQVMRYALPQRRQHTSSGSAGSRSNAPPQLGQRDTSRGRGRVAMFTRATPGPTGRKEYGQPLAASGSYRCRIATVIYFTRLADTGHKNPTGRKMHRWARQVTLPGEETSRQGEKEERIALSQRRGPVRGRHLPGGTDASQTPGSPTRVGALWSGRWLSRGGTRAVPGFPQERGI